MGQPRITFGIIVLNGEPFTRYNLRALYPFAHEIIAVEGASPHAAHGATPDGHSIDGTLDALRRFKAEEDPEQKLTIVTAEEEGHPSGFWPGEKDEQSRAYARRATGEWLWQVDIDEFYQPADMAWICAELLTRPEIWTLSFQQLQFWGGLRYLVDGWYLRHHGGAEFNRVFRWGAGYQYATHRPPTVLNAEGVNLRELGWVRGRSLAARGIALYHYSLVFPTQVRAKVRYYGSLFGRSSQEVDRSYTTLERPYRVHNVPQYPSWLDRYDGPHPPQALAMWEAAAAHSRDGGAGLRPTDDIERLLGLRWYGAGRLALRLLGSAYYGARGALIRLLRPAAVGRYRTVTL
jgi:hypothetical protein